jgi:hypothetical protein
MWREFEKSFANNVCSTSMAASAQLWTFENQLFEQNETLASLSFT